MGIRSPRISLSRNDKELLLLISKLVVEPSLNENHTNVPKSHIALSDDDAERLLNLLNTLLNDQNFKESRNFIEEITKLNSANEKKVRSIYSTALQRRNESTTITHHRWYELQARLGLKDHGYMGKEIIPMTTKHFFEMENKLFHEMNLDPRVINILMKLGEKSSKVIEDFKKGLKKEVDISASAIKLQKDIKGESIVSRIDLSSVAFVVANTTILFTTRDWTATGVWSCMLGKAINSIKLKS